MTPQALDNWRAAVLRARDWLHARGIAYVFTIAPDKHVIYPEEMPPTLARVRRRLAHRPAVHGAAGHRARRRPAAGAVRGQEQRAASTTRPIRTGTTAARWSRISRSSTPCARACRPRRRPGRGATSTPVDRTVEGLDLAGMMGLKRVLREIDLALVPSARAARASSSRLAPRPPPKRAARHRDRRPSLPRAVIFRDSFVSRLVPFLSEHFSRAVYLWQNDFDAATSLTRNIPTSSSRRSSAAISTTSSRRRSWCRSHRARWKNERRPLVAQAF